MSKASADTHAATSGWPEKIPDLTGDQYILTDLEYNYRNFSYATTSCGEDHQMNPGLIVYPHDARDVGLTLQYAKAHGKAVAVRTGGHQYSGASSTTHENILIDVSKTWAHEEPILTKDDSNMETATLKISVSWKLADFNQWVRDKKHGVFVPTGQCAGVMIGGHVQTGGYGKLFEQLVSPYTKIRRKSTYTIVG